MWRNYFQTHYNIGLEIAVVLCLLLFNFHLASTRNYFFYATFPFWLFSGSLLLTPSLFNPSGLEWKSVVDDWHLWHCFFSDNVSDDEQFSWLAWFTKRMLEPMKCVPFSRRVFLVFFPRCRKLVSWWGLCAFAARSTRNSNSGSLDQANRSFSTLDMMMNSAGMIAIWWFINLARTADKTEVQSRTQRTFKCCSRLHTHTYRVGNLGILIIVACSAIGLVSAGRMRLVTVGYFLLATCFLTHWLVFDVVLVFAAGFVTSANSDGSGLLKRAFAHEIMDCAAFFHYMMGVAMLVPLVCASFLPFLHELQMRLLFNPEYADELTSAQVLHKEKEREKRQLLGHTYTPSSPARKNGVEITTGDLLGGFDADSEPRDEPGVGESKHGEGTSHGPEHEPVPEPEPEPLPEHEPAPAPAPVPESEEQSEPEPEPEPEIADSNESDI